MLHDLAVYSRGEKTPRKRELQANLRRSVRGAARSDRPLRPQTAELVDSKRGSGRASAQPVQRSARFRAAPWQTGVGGFKHLALLLSEHFSDLDNIPYSPSSPRLKPFRAFGRQFLGLGCPLVGEDKNFTYSLELVGKIACSLLNCSNYLGILY